MPDWPKDTLDLNPFGTLCSGGENSMVSDAMIASVVTMSGTASWPVANAAIYIPVLVRSPTTVYQLAWGNGATLGSNVDVGIYDGSSKSRLISTGSTAQSGVSQIQVVDVTDTPIPIGLHYLAMAMDSISGIVNRGAFGTATQLLRVCGCAQQLTAFPLPSTATFAALATVNSLPFIVAAISGSVF